MENEFSKLARKAGSILSKDYKRYNAYFELIIETLIKEKENEYNVLIKKLQKYIYPDKKNIQIEKEEMRNLLFGYVVFYKINSIILNKGYLDENPISKILNEILILYIKD